MGKFKVGDKVKVRKDLIVEQKYGNQTFVDDMKNLCGKTVTIESVIDYANYYGIKEDGYWWTDEMFESNEVLKNLVNITRIVRNKKTTVVFWDDGSKTIVKLGANQIDSQEMAILWAYFVKNSGLSKTKAHKVMEDLINNIYQQDIVKIKFKNTKVKLSSDGITIKVNKIVLPKTKEEQE